MWQELTDGPRDDHIIFLPKRWYPKGLFQLGADRGS